MLYALAIAAFVFWCLPETLPKDNRAPARPSAMLGGFAKGLTCGAFVAGILAHGVLFMGGILYSAGSADFVIKVMHLDVDGFGWLSIPLVFVSFAGAWGSVRLARRLRPKRMVIVVTLLTLAASLAAAWADTAPEASLFLLLACPVLYSFGMALLRPVMMAMNMDYFPANRGMPAAMQQFCVTGSFCIAAALLVPLVMGSAALYALASAACALGTLLLWMLSMRLRPSALAKAGVTETVK